MTRRNGDSAGSPGCIADMELVARSWSAGPPSPVRTSSHFTLAFGSICEPQASDEIGYLESEESLSQELWEYRPHRPHRLQCGRLQGFLAVYTKHCLPTAREYYRPLLHLPPAYRLRRNVVVCRHFCYTKGLRSMRAMVLASSTDGL
jgi:hypothetical protein